MSHPASPDSVHTFPSIDVLLFPSYDGKIKDFNFGSLVRTDSREEYSERNTIFGVSRYYS